MMEADVWDTVHRDLRLPREVDDELARLAEAANMGYNAFIIQLLQNELNKEGENTLVLDSMLLPSFGWSDHALKHHLPGCGGSYSTLSCDDVCRLVENNWDKREPGTGETTLERKVLVPVDPTHFHCTSLLLTEQMRKARISPIKARVRRRQKEDADLSVVHSIRRFWAWIQRIKIQPEPAKYVKIVLYSRDTLLENGGSTSTECDWEIIAILASPIEVEPMHPLTMARNMLEKPGGTYGKYSAEQFAEAIMYWSQRVRL